VPVAESPTVALRAAFKPNWETEMPLNEGNDPEMSYRRGYQDGALETFHAVERFLDPAVREVVSTWIEQDVNGWRLKAMLDYPPTWRLASLNGPTSS
jgi:hypothetical protein